MFFSLFEYAPDEYNEPCIIPTFNFDFKMGGSNFQWICGGSKVNLSLIRTKSQYEYKDKHKQKHKHKIKYKYKYKHNHILMPFFCFYS